MRTKPRFTMSQQKKFALPQTLSAFIFTNTVHVKSYRRVLILHRYKWYIHHKGELANDHIERNRGNTFQLI